MVRILIVIAVVFAWVFIRFLVAYNKQRNAIAAKGGIKTIYKPLIDGLLEYRSAQIIQDKKDFITIGWHLYRSRFQQRVRLMDCHHSTNIQTFECEVSSAH